MPNKLRFKQLENKMPSLELAKKLCNEYKRPLHNHVLIINAVAPMVTAGGVILSEAAQGQHQQQMNLEGMMVVLSPFEREFDENNKEILNHSAIYEGEHVLYLPDASVAFMTTVTSDELLDGLQLEEGEEPKSEMYKKYVIMNMSIHQFSMVLNR